MSANKLEQLYRRCPYWPRGSRPCMDNHCPDNEGECIIPIEAEKPQKEAYSPADTIEFFNARIDEHPELKALGLHARMGDMGIGFVEFLNVDDWPDIHAEPGRLVVYANLNENVLCTISCQAAWDAFLAEVKKVYPKMCLDWLKQQRPDVGWGFGIHGNMPYILSGDDDLPAFDPKRGWDWRDSSLTDCSFETIADFLAEYNRQHPQSTVKVVAGKEHVRVYAPREGEGPEVWVSIPKSELSDLIADLQKIEEKP